MLWRLAKQICEEYRDLGVSLNVPTCVINEIEADNRGSVANTALKILEKWMKADKRQDMYEMYNELLDALSSFGRNDLVLFVKAGE